MIEAAVASFLSDDSAERLEAVFARRMDRRGGTAQIPNEVSSQLAHLNQAVDAIALEVERISEGQRFTTKLLSEHNQMLPKATPRQLTGNTPT